MKKTKSFIKQIKIEIRKMFGSKFTIILIALLLLMSALLPVLSASSKDDPDVYYYSSDGTPDIISGDYVITKENPLYWHVKNNIEDFEYMTESASSDSDDMRIEYFEMFLEKSLYVINEIENHESYKETLVWDYEQFIKEIYILEHIDMSEEVLEKILASAYQDDYYRSGQGTQELLNDEIGQLKLTDIERIAKFEEIEKEMARIEAIIINDDYIEYYHYEIEQEEEKYQTNLVAIAKLEEDIIENLSDEEIYSKQIDSYINENSKILEIQMPYYEYAIEHDVEPVQSDWKYVALKDKKNRESNLLNSTVLTEKEYEEDSSLTYRYGTYNEYRKAIQTRIDVNTETLIIAKSSLENGKPDMKYVDNGTRKKVAEFLWVSLIISILIAMIGGGIISTEFQTGTIRLLLIRPKTRAKIALSKLGALLTIGFSVYLLAVLLNALMNGIFFGFSDFSYPNYSLSSGANGISFFAYYVPKFLACSISILFACAVTYFFSIFTRNTALSVAIPIVIFLASYVLTQILLETSKSELLFYTPIPYVNLALLYMLESYYSSITPIMGLGIPLIIVISLAMVVLGTIIFKKRDITA